MRSEPPSALSTSPWIPSLPARVGESLLPAAGTARRAASAGRPGRPQPRQGLANWDGGGGGQGGRPDPGSGGQSRLEGASPNVVSCRALKKTWPRPGLEMHRAIQRGCCPSPLTGTRCEARLFASTRFGFLVPLRMGSKEKTHTHTQVHKPDQA